MKKRIIAFSMCILMFLSLMQMQVEAQEINREAAEIYFPNNMELQLLDTMEISPYVICPEMDEFEVTKFKLRILSGKNKILVEGCQDGYELLGEKCGKVRLELIVEGRYWHVTEDKEYEEQYNMQDCGKMTLRKKVSVRVVANKKIKDISKYYVRTSMFYLEKGKKNSVYLVVNNVTNKPITIYPTNMQASQIWYRTWVDVFGFEHEEIEGKYKCNTRITKKVVVKPTKIKKIKIKVNSNSINTKYAMELRFKCKWKGKQYKLKAHK